MEPGTELDNEIHDNVMNASPYMSAIMNGPFEVKSIEYTVPPYSTDIKAAWEVVEKLWEQEIGLNVEREWFSGPQWVVKITVRKEDDDWTTAETPAHAICLAALKTTQKKTGNGV